MSETGRQFGLKVGISGVRGVTGETFTPRLALNFAQAFGLFVGAGDVVIGRDTRTSGPMVEAAVMAGLQSVGCRPLLAGVVPTPTVQMLVQHHGARGGMVISASHNPPEWNALKFIGRRGIFLNAVRSEELFDIYHQQDFQLVGEAGLRPAEKINEPMAVHEERILRYIDPAPIRAAGLKVAVDCCNGVGAVWSVPFLKKLGCEVVALHDAPTGFFERGAEPLPAHLSVLCEAVRREQCALGFAQDPDGDRLAIVDENGQPIGEDLTVALALLEVLEQHEQGPVAINLSTSRTVEDALRAAGAEVHRTRIGEINVVEAMLRIGAVAGGEHNGGVIVPAVHPCRDSFTGMALVLSRLARGAGSIAQQVAALPAYHLLKIKQPVRTEQVPALLRTLRRRYADRPVSTLDGVYVTFETGWLHVRPSNTEPVLRLTAEFKTRAEAEQCLQDAQRCLVD
jgi:phosphomannomutase